MQTELDIHRGFLNYLIYTQIVYPPSERQDPQMQIDSFTVPLGVVTLCKLELESFFVLLFHLSYVYPRATCSYTAVGVRLEQLFLWRSGEGKFWGFLAMLSLLGWLHGANSKKTLTGNAQTDVHVCVSNKNIHRSRLGLNLACKWYKSRILIDWLFWKFYVPGFYAAWILGRESGTIATVIMWLLVLLDQSLGYLWKTLQVVQEESFWSGKKISLLGNCFGGDKISSRKGNEKLASHIEVMEIRWPSQQVLHPRML